MTSVVELDPTAWVVENLEDELVREGRSGWGGG